MILNFGPIGLDGADVRFGEFNGDWNIPSSILVARDINKCVWSNIRPCMRRWAALLTLLFFKLFIVFNDDCMAVFVVIVVFVDVCGSSIPHSDNDGDENADGNCDDVNIVLPFCRNNLLQLLIDNCGLCGIIFSSNGVPSSDSYVIRISVWAKLPKLDKPDDDDDDDELPSDDGVGDLDIGDKSDVDSNVVVDDDDEGDDGAAMIFCFSWLTIFWW